MMISLYSYLKKFYPGFKDKKDFTKENVFARLYYNEEYDDKKFRDRFSDMLKLACEYLAFIDFRSDKIGSKKHQMNQFVKRSLKIHFDKVYRELETELEKTNIKNNHYFYESYLLKKDKYIPIENEKIRIKHLPLYDNVAEEVELFLRFFVSKMVKYYSMMNNMEKHIAHKFDYKMYEPVMKFAEENGLTVYPSINLFYLRLKLYEDINNEDRFFELKNYVIANNDVLEPRDSAMIITDLFNLAHIHFITGKKGYDVQRFEMMDLGLKSEVFNKERGWFRSFTFINFVHVAMQVGKTEWTMDFMKNYIERVAPEFRDNTGFYTNSYMNYYNRNYKEALRFNLMIKIKNRDYILYSWAKNLLLRIYYELKDYENVFMIVDSFKHYLVTFDFIPEGNVK